MRLGARLAGFAGASLLAFTVGAVALGAATLELPLASLGGLTGAPSATAGSAASPFPGTGTAAPSQPASPGVDAIVQQVFANAPSRPAAEAVLFAIDQLGVEYRWGGNGPRDGGFDCSGLTEAAYAAAGISIPRVAQAQFDAGPQVPAGKVLAPGDLVFFGASPANVTHVGIFVGSGEMIDAPHTGALVRVEPVWQDELVGATRPWASP